MLGKPLTFDSKMQPSASVRAVWERLAAAFAESERPKDPPKSLRGDGEKKVLAPNMPGC